MYTADQRVGRLMEVRLAQGASLQDHQTLNSKVYALLARMPGGAVFCTDMRGVDVLSEEIADRMASSYRVANVKVLRTAIVVRPNAAVRTQIERIVRDAGSPARHVFVDVDAAKRWLAEVLDANEIARVAAFLAETT
jgi:hypothetical protein